MSLMTKALLEDLKRRTGFTEQHARLLQDLGQYMTPMASEIALAFYDYLGRDPEMRTILWALPGRVERLYGRFADWYRELFSGVYDEHYAESRRRIGLVHARLGIRPAFIIPAMGIVQELSLEHMNSVLKASELLAAVEAFEKVIAIELAILQESYSEAVEAGIRAGMASSEAALTQGAELLLQEKA
jgi:hypothetical protein